MPIGSAESVRRLLRAHEAREQTRWHRGRVAPWLPLLAVSAGAVFASMFFLPQTSGSLGDVWRNFTRAGSAGSKMASETTIVGRASVIDGDTLEIRGMRIRLNGIDAPESRQTCHDLSGAEYRCGQRAAFALADKIGRRNIACQVVDEDRYGRAVATCRLDGLDVNGWMVTSGWALAYRQYSRAYIDEEATAEAAQAGVWAGAFTVPWDWRAAR